MRRMLTALLICAASSAAAGVYKWTDANGKVHYSDQPPPDTDAGKLSLTKPSGFSAPDAPSASPEKTPSLKHTASNAERREQAQKQHCAQLRAEQQRLDNSPSGNALKDGNQRAARAFALEQNTAMLKELGCEAAR